MSEERDQYKRQLSILETYLKGRMIQLDKISKQQNGEVPACDMAKSEIMSILDEVIPQMREVLP